MFLLRIALVLCAFPLLGVALHAQSKCDDPLRMTIWRTLDKDLLSGPWDCRKVLQIKSIQLGSSEGLIVRGYGPPLCGATGDCSTWIVQQRAKRFRVLLDAGSVIETIDIKKRRRGQYPDLIFRHRMGASDRYVERYRFDGRRYRLTSCVYESYSTDGKRTVKKEAKRMCQ